MWTDATIGGAVTPHIDRLISWLESLTPTQWREIAVAGLFVLAAYLALAWTIRRLLPWLVEHLALLAGIGVVVATGVLLSIQAGIALSFRALRHRPPALLYRLGDGLANGAAGLRTRLRRPPRWTARLRGARAAVLLLLLSVGYIWSHHDICVHDSRSLACRQPVSAVAQATERLGDWAVSFIAS